MQRLNALGQPIGAALPGWTAPPVPPRTVMQGRHCQVAPLDEARHAGDLFAANAADRDGRMWTYMFYGPFATLEAYRLWARDAAASADPLYHAIVDVRTGRAAGIAAYLRIDPPAGVIEIGHIALSPALQRTAAATEAIYLLARRAFDELGYRRLEWTRTFSHHQQLPGSSRREQHDWWVRLGSARIDARQHRDSPQLSF